MPTTLAQLATSGRHGAVFAAVTLSSLLATACVGLGGGASPLPGDEVALLGPAEPGTYRMVGTERDSRSGRDRRVVETYRVEPHFTRGGEERQITGHEDSEGSSRTWETSFRRTGSYRLHETAGEASWDWVPPLRSIAAPLRVGRTWVTESTATLPDLGGTRRVTSVAARSEVVDTTTMSVGGKRLFVLVIDATVSTTVTDTNRVDRKSTTTLNRTRARTWFSPEHMLVVRSTTSTTVKVRPGTGEHVVVRRLQVQEL